MFIFPAQSLLLDEFNAIKQHIAQNCLTSKAADHIRSMMPDLNLHEIEKHSGQTEEMRLLIEANEPFPASGYHDISKEIQLLNIQNSVLAPTQLLHIAALATTAGQIIHFFEQRESFSLLKEILNNCHYETAITREVENVLDAFGQVKSSASYELQQIRRNIQRQRIEADKVYQQVIARYKKNGWLTESEESSRNGRRVLSIVAEQKRSINGVIHDMSATGKTVFIEPHEVLDINNRVFQLEQEERLEVTRLLRQLTVFLRGHLSLIKQYASIITEMDVHRAKALYALQYRATLPTFSEKRELLLTNAAHPLLLMQQQQLQKPVVTFSIQLDSNNRILIISGPNAGGKSVCMKTVALLLLMAQSGFHITAQRGSHLCIFEKLLVDIGDAQSIEYELSTYSSRLKNMNIFLQEANNKTLFIIDELGSGTDPQLGGALAEALLEALNSKQATGIVTTHFMNLKVLAERISGFINGSMTFDKRNLKPLYQLQIGKPGSSYTFVVAQRSGLPDDIINKARSKVQRNHLLLENLLARVEKEKILMTEKLKAVSDKEKVLNSLIRENDKLIFSNENLKNSLHQHLRSHQEKLDQKAEARIKKFAFELQKAKNKKQVIEKFLHEAGLKKQKVEKVIPRTVDPRIQTGTTVKLYNGKVAGVVQSIQEQSATVVFGNFTTKCKLEDLILHTP